jgi:hypothetical protein
MTRRAQVERKFDYAMTEGQDQKRQKALKITSLKRVPRGVVGKFQIAQVKAKPGSDA